MFASDPHKPSSQRRMNSKFISIDDEDFVHESTFQLTRKKRQENQWMTKESRTFRGRAKIMQTVSPTA